MRIEILPRARAGVAHTSDTFGMTQVAIVSRLIDWIVQQPDLIQGSILQQLPSDFNAETVKSILRDMASEKNKNTAQKKPDSVESGG
jgi:hypothetical protein